MPDAWVPVWSNIVESSLWEEPDFVIKVFLTMMVKKDADDVVRADPHRIAKWANKTEDEVIEALKVLEAPDRRKKTVQPEEGRRIRAVRDGWFIINAAKYREEMQNLFQRARKAQLQREYRHRQKEKKNQAGRGAGAGGAGERAASCGEAYGPRGDEPLETQSEDELRARQFWGGNGQPRGG